MPERTLQGARCWVARACLLALYPLRVAVDVVFGQDPLPRDYVSPTTGRQDAA